MGAGGADPNMPASVGGSALEINGIAPVAARGLRPRRSNAILAICGRVAVLSGGNVSGAIDWSLDPRLRSVLGRLPLPVKLPTPLRRVQGGGQDRPLDGMRAALTRLRGDGDVVLATALAIGGAAVTILDPRPELDRLEGLQRLSVRHSPAQTDLHSALAATSARQDRRPLVLVHRVVAPGAGDIAVNDATDLLFQVGQAMAQAPAGSRLLVLCDPPREGDLRGRITVAAVAGCLRSLHKELGPQGSTCHLLRLRADADAAALADVVQFLASPRASFLTALDLTVGAATGPDAPWQGKVALVTGAARGIGAAIASQLAVQGATVWVNDVPQAEQAARQTLDDIARLGGQGHFVAADCSSEAGARAIAKAIERAGRLDAVIHNAGITRDRTLRKMAIEQWRQVLSVDLASMDNVQRAVDPFLSEGAGLVLLSSVMGIAGNFGQTNYTAAKSGVVELARAWAESYRQRGIRANAIAPGFILTEMTAHLPLLNKEMAKQLTSLLQPGLPSDVAHLAVFLSGSGSRALSGQTLRCDGGMGLGA